MSFIRKNIDLSSTTSYKRILHVSYTVEQMVCGI